MYHMVTVPLTSSARFRVWSAIAATVVVVCLNAILTRL
jgi:hypothetical protein